MTDETARTNWELYGNPDGPRRGSVSVAIAMPRLFLVKRHQVKILLTGFSVLLIAVPLFFYLNLSDSLNKDDNGVNNKNRQLFGSELDSDVSFDDIPMILFKSVELQSITPKSSHLTLLKRLNEDLQS